MILGITGGTGCGKTTLLKLIAAQGGVIFDCDAIYHALLETDGALLQAIEDAFPGSVEHGVLQRKKLGQQVFADPQKLRRLNEITHGAVRREVEQRLAARPPLAAIDAIGLFESGLDTLCDRTVAVLAPRETRIARLMARDGISAEYAAARIDAQPGDQVFRSRCTCVLENNGTISEFQDKCLAFLQASGIMTVSSTKENSL